MLYGSHHSSVPTPSPPAQRLLLYCLQNWTDQSETCMHPVIAFLERTRVQFSLRTIQSSYSLLPLCTSSKLNSCFRTTISRQTVQMHLKRSPRHTTFRIAAYRFSLSKCAAVQSPISRSQPSSTSSFSPSFMLPMAPPRK